MSSVMVRSAIAMHPAYPIDLRPYLGANPLHQLTGMLHQVAEREDLKLHCNQVIPKPLWCFQLQLRYSPDYLLLAKGQVFQEGLFIVRLAALRRRKIFITMPVFRPRNGGCRRFLQVFM